MVARLMISAVCQRAWGRGVVGGGGAACGLHQIDRNHSSASCKQAHLAGLQNHCRHSRSNIPAVGQISQTSLTGRACMGVKKSLLRTQLVGTSTSGSSVGEGGTGALPSADTSTQVCRA